MSMIPTTHVLRSISSVLVGQKRKARTTEYYPNASPKPFCPKLHEENDIRGREIAKDLLTQFIEPSLYVQDNPEIYEIDLVIYSRKTDYKVAFVEVEVKSGWEGLYPFPDIRVPLRKQKYFLDSRIPTFILIFSGDMKQAILLTGDSVGQGKIVRIDNRLQKDEPFFSIGLDKAIFMQVPHGKTF